MKVYPAIDLLEGKCVRLHQGSFEQVSVYSEDPMKMAETLVRDGAKRLHLVDLSGAKKPEAAQTELIGDLCRKYGDSVWIQAGGGLRSLEQASRFLAAGVKRVVIGTLAIKNPARVEEMIREFGGDRLTLALDMQPDADGQPVLAAEGWQQLSDTSKGRSFWDVFSFYVDRGVEAFLCTDISKDGTLQGPNFAFYSELLQRFPEVELQASGGVSSLDDLKRLKKAGVPAVIVGKALYERRFTLQDIAREVTSC